MIIDHLTQSQLNKSHALQDIDEQEEKESVEKNDKTQRRNSKKSSISEQKTLKNGPYQQQQYQQKEVQEEVMPQVRQLLRKNTYVSSSSRANLSNNKQKMSRLQSLQYSARSARIAPEEWISQSRRNSQDQSEFDSFFEESESLEVSDECRFRYDKRYSSIQFMIYPDDPLKLVWDAIVIMALLYICFVIPFNIAFNNDEDQNLSNEIYDDIGIAVDVIYGLDIIITIFTAYLDSQEELVVDRKLIIRNYLTGWFLLDVICLIPFDQLFDSNATFTGAQKFAKLPKAYKMLKLLKMSRVLKFCLQRRRYGEVLTTLSNNNVRVMALSLISVLFVSHFCSCIWYFVGVVSSESNTWVNTYVGESEETLEKYIMSFYWVFQTMATTGYGDITARNSVEELLACFLMIFGVAFFSVTIGSVSSLLTQLDTQNVRLKEKMDILNQIAREHNIDNQLYAKVSKILKKGYKNNQNEIVEFLHHIPLNLRTELSQAMYKNVFSDIELFKNKPLRFTAYVGPLLTILQIQEGDIIYNEGDYSNEIFFIKDGCVGFCMKEHDYQPFYRLEQGKYFGEYELIKESTRQNTSIALKDCELLSLNKSNFYKIFFSEFKDIGEELHEASRRMRKEVSIVKQQFIQNIESAEQQQQQQGAPLKKLAPFFTFQDLSTQKCIKITSKQSKDTAQKRDSDQKRDSLPDSDQPSPSHALRSRMTKLKTVLLQKGIIHNAEDMPKRDPQKTRTSILTNGTGDGGQFVRNPKKKSLTMLMKQEETSKRMPNSTYMGNIEFLKRQGKNRYM